MFQFNILILKFSINRIISNANIFFNAQYSNKKSNANTIFEIIFLKILNINKINLRY